MVRLCAVAALLCAAVAAASAFAQSPGSLQGQIDRGRARERTLGTAAARLGRLESATRARDSHPRAAPASRRDGARPARGRGWPPRARAWPPCGGGRSSCAAAWRTDRAQLATLLRERYMDDKPDFVTVVLRRATASQQLLETLSFLRRVERSDTRRRRPGARARKAAAAREQRAR